MDTTLLNSSVIRSMVFRYIHYRDPHRINSTNRSLPLLIYRMNYFDVFHALLHDTLPKRLEIPAFAHQTALDKYTYVNMSC